MDRLDHKVRRGRWDRKVLLDLQAHLVHWDHLLQRGRPDLPGLKARLGHHSCPEMVAESARNRYMMMID